MKILLLALCLTLAACSQKNAPDTSTMPAESLPDAKALARNATVECKAGADCSPSVGLLAVANPDSTSSCTASLVAPDVLATNSHCVPDDLKKPDSICRDRIWMHFVADASKPAFETILECDKIIFASGGDGGPKNPDFAYIKLAKASARPVLMVSRLGLATETKYTLHRVSPANGLHQLHGVQDSESCVAIQGSDLVPDFKTDHSHVAMMGDCEVLHGNSGGPLLDAAGQVRGVIFAFFEKSYLDFFSQRFAKISRREETGKLNLASNFSCLNTFDDPEIQRLPSFCGTENAGAQKTDPSVPDPRLAKITSQVVDEMRTRSGAAADFEWSTLLEDQGLEVTWVSGGYTVRPVPTCVRAAALSSYLNTQVNISLPSWTIRESYDRYLRVGTDLQTEAPWTGALGLKAAGGLFEVSLGDSGSSDGLEIPVCN